MKLKIIMPHRLRGCSSILIFLIYSCCLTWNLSSALCPVRCSCNDETLSVHCESANLVVVPITLNPELKELHLGRNHIKSIKASVTVYYELEFLNISHNQLVTLDEGTFRHQGRLKSLLLQRNMISKLQNESLAGLRSLDFLHLEGNFLAEITESVFSQLSSLKKLNLCQNRLSKIANNAFIGLSKLETLLLRENKLSTIPKQAFEKVTNLIKLDLGLNSFREVPENAFSPLSKLRELSLDGCGIISVHYGAFKWLSALLILRLNDNELTEVPSRALFDVVRLEELHIGQNKFSVLKSMSFQRLRYLRTLRMDGARQLLKIQPKAFVENVNLQEVHFEHNDKLKIVERGAFEGLSHLRRVSLRGNAFETFDPELLPWNELTYLDVRDNPLVCNCSVLWLWHLLRTRNFSKVPDDDITAESDSDKVVCVEPQQFRGRVLKDMYADDLECSDVKAKRMFMIGLLATSVALVTAILTLGVRYRGKLAGMLKTKWNGGRKEPQYQKTNGDEETTIIQATQQSLKLTPVMEL